MRTALAIVYVVIATVMTITFIESLPAWYANPQGSGNWVVQPLCVK